MTNPKYPAAILVSLFAIGVVIVATFVFVVGSDDPPVVDSDLALPERIVDPAQNPFPAIRNLVLTEEGEADVNRVNEMHQEREALDSEFVDSVLDDFEKELALFEEYAAMSDWKVDGELGLTSPLGDYLQSVRKLALLKQSEILRHLDRGETATAIEKTFLVMRFGEGMKHCDGNLIHYLVGNAIAAIGRGIILKIVERGDLELEELASVARQLDQFKVGTEGLENALRVEYRASSALLDDVASGKIDLGDINDGTPSRGFPMSPGLFFKVNRTKQVLAELFRENIRELPLVRKDAPNAASKRLEGMAKNRIMVWLGGNPVGEILLMISAPAYEQMLHVPAQSLAEHNLVRLRIAMERYRLSKGDWPPSLEALVPGFIDGVPIDRMDGEPLRFNRETLRIYSVGMDFIDAGGDAKESGQMRDRDEIVIELE